MRTKRRTDNCISKKDARAICGGSDVATENRFVIPEQHHCTVLALKFQMEVTVHERLN